MKAQKYTLGSIKVGYDSSGLRNLKVAICKIYFFKKN